MFYKFFLFTLSIVFFGLLMGCSEENKLPIETESISSLEKGEMPTEITASYFWQTIQNNNNNSYWGAFNLSGNDRYIQDIYNQTLNNNFISIINPIGYRSCAINSSYSSFYHSSGQNLGNSGWMMRSEDIYVPYGFYSTSNLYGGQMLAINNSNHWAALLSRNGTTGTYHWDWGNNGNEWIGGWHMRSEDIYITGNFNPNEPNKMQILFINGKTHWASLLQYEGTTSSWISPYSNGGNGWIGGWYMPINHKYRPIDFDGDGITELFCYSASWVAVLKYNGSNWDWVWGNNGNGMMGDWQMNFVWDRIGVGNFTNNGNKEQLLFTNSSSTSKKAALYIYNGSTGLNKIWYNGGNGYIGDYPISYYDTMLKFSDFPSNSLKSLFISNGARAISLRLKSNQVQDDDNTDQ